jgi:hypothetical protein
VTILVDVAAAEAKMPVDDPDRALENEAVQTGLFGGLAHSGFRGRLVALEVSLGKTPVLVRVPDQQVPGALSGYSSEDNSPGADLELGATLTH